MHTHSFIYGDFKFIFELNLSQSGQSVQQHHLCFAFQIQIDIQLGTNWFHTGVGSEHFSGKISCSSDQTSKEKKKCWHTHFPTNCKVEWTVKRCSHKKWYCWTEFQHSEGIGTKQRSAVWIKWSNQCTFSEEWWRSKSQSIRWRIRSKRFDCHLRMYCAGVRIWAATLTVASKISLSAARLKVVRRKFFIASA